MIELIEAGSDREYAETRGLFEAYAHSLEFDLGFQGFAEELAGLPGDYAPPRGCILLAREAARPVGCVALRPLDAESCEMKRLYAIPEVRGRGVGRRLAEAVIAKARELGYARMKLDTVGSMTAAIALYRELGFRPTAAYCFNPRPDVLFFALGL